MTVPTTVDELYPSKWLHAEDLGGRAHDLVIESVAVEEFRQPGGERAMRAVVTFRRAKKRLVCNKTQAVAIAGITGSPAFADWPGHEVRLAPGRASNGKGTILVLTLEGEE
jgi:hypothetical protein